MKAKKQKSSGKFCLEFEDGGLSYYLQGTGDIYGESVYNIEFDIISVGIDGEDIEGVTPEEILNDFKEDIVHAILENSDYVPQTKEDMYG